jgi:hypothetical protein
MWDKIKNLKNLIKTDKKKKTTKKLTDKEIADKKKEPYVQVLSMDIDPDNPSDGAFELDWNDIFVARLIKSGYQGKTDADIVDNWFQAVCRNVVMENYEQEQADPERRSWEEKKVTNKRDLGDGRSEIS